MQQGNGLQSPLRPVTVLFFHLLLAHLCSGQSELITPPQPTVTTVGDDIILPCHLKPEVDVVATTLEWKRPDLKPIFVHVRRSGQDIVRIQHPSFKGRTSVSIDELKHGNVSLKLSKVKPSDAGRYQCYIPKLDTGAFVELVVGAASSLVINLLEINRIKGGVVLQCNSTGWYPEPEVLWLDGEGNLLSAGPTETVRGPDDLYTVSSRVTVEKRHSNSFTCRVQQNHTNQIRETLIHVPEDVFMEPSSSSVALHVILSVVCILVFSALVFAVWKLRQNKSQHKKHHNKGPEEGPEETELLICGQKKREDLDEGKLKEKVEEKMAMMYVISDLTEKKKELEDHRDKLMSQIERLETERTENEKKLQSFFSMNKNNLSDKKLQLDYKKTEYEKSLQRITGGIQTTEDIITIITERMKKVEKHVREMSEQPEDTNRGRDEIHHQSDQSESKEETDRNTDVLMTAETQPNLHVSDSPAGGSSSHGESGTAEQTENKPGEMMDDTVEHFK